MANALRDRTKHPKPYTLDDAVPPLSWAPRLTAASNGRQQQSVEEMFAVAQMITESYKGLKTNGS